MNYKVPTLEEIYNEYYRETFFVSKGFYPKSIKNFDSVLTNEKRDFLLKFQNVIKRNYDMLDWKIYIKACSKYFKRKFDLNILGSLKANKIYRTYISYNNIEMSSNDIKDEIKNSIKFLIDFCRENAMSIKDYVNDRTTPSPIILKHIYSGSVSQYFYACFSHDTLFRLFRNIDDDDYYELFNCSRNEFLENNLYQKHDKMIRNNNLFEFINIINDKFKSKI